MSGSPYIPFYTSDFLSGTGGMTAATKGVYITLLCLMYEAEGPLPQSWDSLARRCGCTLPAFKKAIEALSDDFKIEVCHGGLWSRKCEKHIAQRGERRGSASAAAKKRWEKTPQKQRASDASASVPQCQPEPEPYKEDKSSLGPSASKQKNASRLSEDWTLPLEWGQWALSEGWSEQAVRLEAEKFRDYWIGVGGAKGRKLNWQATWRNWMRNAKSPRNAGGPTEERRHGKRSIADNFSDSIPEVDSGQDRNPSQPLLSADGRRTDRNGGDAGLGDSADGLFTGTDRRRV